MKTATYDEIAKIEESILWHINAIESGDDDDLDEEEVMEYAEMQGYDFDYVLEAKEDWEKVTCISWKDMFISIFNGEI